MAVETVPELRKTAYRNTRLPAHNVRQLTDQKIRRQRFIFDAALVSIICVGGEGEGGEGKWGGGDPGRWNLLTKPAAKFQSFH